MIKYLVEFIGTFVFLSVILAVGKPIPIAVGLLAAIYFGGHISGGHFNPAVSVMMFLKENLSANDLPMYVIAQVAGGAVAHYFNLATAVSA
jgi:aquaporin Z